MAIKRAKVLNDEQFSTLIDITKIGLHPERDVVMLGLSFKCGLRSKEIAGLRWLDVLDAEDQLLPAGSFIELGHHITKGKKADTKAILHPFVAEALPALRSLEKETDYLMYAPRGGHMTANNVTVYLHQLYERAGFKGCSSHTGRRTFGTNLSRKCNLHGGSIVDVQNLLRHADIRTTKAYIEPSDTQISLAMSA